MIHNHIVNQRADYLHKTSAEIAKRYNVICEYAVHVKQRVWKWEIDDEWEIEDSPESEEATENQSEEAPQPSISEIEFPDDLGFGYDDESPIE